MKKLFFTLFFVIGTGTFCIYGQTKNDDILKLLRISGTDKLTEQIMSAMITEFEELIPGIPDTFWISFWNRFREKINIDDMLYSCIPAYSKYYSHNEIKQLIKFYESPIGKKVVRVTPLLTQETMIIGQKWGEKISQDIINELLIEGYIIY